MSQSLTISATDAINLEVLRSRLEAICNEAAASTELTAISPVITEAKDYSATILDADGGMLSGGGRIEHHFGASVHAVQYTIATHGGSIAPGDVFLSNDPHHGGGLHAQDVVVQRPVFVGDALIGWTVLQGHMMDVGGMAPGSWAPSATDCYQEALRFPPVRLFSRGVEQQDVWTIFRNNVRLVELVEMDLRGLVAGTHIAGTKLQSVVEDLASARYLDLTTQLCDRSEQALRERISLLEDGVYSIAGWAEWDEENFRVPCSLVIDGDSLVFDFTGAVDQSSHFFNSKPYIVASMAISEVCGLLAQDLPYNRGVFAPFEFVCPEGSILNSLPPAPVASAHQDVAAIAMSNAFQCVQMALAASPDHPSSGLRSGQCGMAALGINIWSGAGHDGAPDAWLMLDGALPGPSAGFDRDGNDCGSWQVGRGGTVESVDVELLESWYPILVKEKARRTGVHGCGAYRAGAGFQIEFEPHGTSVLQGIMLAMRTRIPLVGVGGGFPGATTSFAVRRSDGSLTVVGGHDMGVELSAGDSFVFAVGSGGGYGDPVLRDVESVARDVLLGRITTDEAFAAYGVVLRHGLVDPVETDQSRAALLARRLVDSHPPECPAPEVVDADVARADPLPLYPGVLQRGRYAVTELGGTVLAEAPNDWIRGCRTLTVNGEERAASGAHVDVIAYLDPGTGHVLYVDVVPEGSESGFASRPNRWAFAYLN